MIEVSVRELKNNLSEYLRRAEAGERVVVTRRGRRVVSLTSEQESQERTLEERWSDLERRGIVTRGAPKGTRLTLPEKLIKLRGEGPTISEIIIRDRR